MYIMYIYSSYVYTVEIVVSLMASDINCFINFYTLNDMYGGNLCKISSTHLLFLIGGIKAFFN
jgi:hypothetical protein